jgi:hypothetical protein
MQDVEALADAVARRKKLARAAREGMMPIVASRRPVGSNERMTDVPPRDQNLAERPLRTLRIFLAVSRIHISLPRVQMRGWRIG